MSKVNRLKSSYMSNGIDWQSVYNGNEDLEQYTNKIISAILDIQVNLDIVEAIVCNDKHLSKLNDAFFSVVMANSVKITVYELAKLCEQKTKPKTITIFTYLNLLKSLKNTPRIDPVKIDEYISELGSYQAQLDKLKEFRDTLVMHNDKDAKAYIGSFYNDMRSLFDYIKKILSEIFKELSGKEINFKIVNIESSKLNKFLASLTLNT